LHRQSASSAVRKKQTGAFRRSSLADTEVWPDSDENLFSSLSETEGSVKIFERNSLKESGAGAETQKASFAGTFSKKQ